MDASNPGISDLETRIAALRAAILKNRAAKKGLPDCPCWGNAPRLVDAELFAVLDMNTDGASVEARWGFLKNAVRKHREEMKITPECTCWLNQAGKADVDLYAALEAK